MGDYLLFDDEVGVGLTAVWLRGLVRSIYCFCGLHDNYKRRGKFCSSIYMFFSCALGVVLVNGRWVVEICVLMRGAVLLDLICGVVSG